MPPLAPAPETGARDQVHVGRQPIYEPDGGLFGYELLFRHSGEASAATSSAVHATARVISNAFTQFGLENLVGGAQCFINLTREFVVGELPLPFEPGRVVLEILETIEVDEEVVAGVRRLHDLGFAIALDDLVLGSEHERLTGIADFVKLDLSATDHLDLGPAVERFHRLGLRVLAERVEDEADVALAIELGFDLLQGYALARPKTLSVDVLETGGLRRLELLAALNGEEIDLADVDALISADPALSLRILQATNSAYAGLRRRVASVREATILLGTTRIRQWVSLMVAAEVAGTGSEHLFSLVTRARMCQAVGEQIGVPGDAAFTVGLLSGIAETLAEPVADLVARLPLAPPVAEALLGSQGPLGSALAAVLSYEEGGVGSGSSLRATEHLDLAEIHLAALVWTNRTLAVPMG